MFEPASPLSPALQADSLSAEPLGKPNFYPRMFKSFHLPLGNSGLKKEERETVSAGKHGRLVYLL